jgi:hypothetical protein
MPLAGSTVKCTGQVTTGFSTCFATTAAALRGFDAADVRLAGRGPPAR